MACHEGTSNFKNNMKFIYLFFITFSFFSYSSDCEYSYEGEVNSEGKPDGQGTEIYNDCDKYVGSFVDGEWLGKGKYIYHDGTSFEGEWLEIQQSDPIKFDFKGTAVYSYEGEISPDDIVEANGKFLRGAQVGRGEVIFRDGTKFVGFFAGDFPRNRDRGQFFYKDGKVLSGQFFGSFYPFGASKVQFPDGSSKYEFNYPYWEDFVSILIGGPLTIAVFLFLYYVRSLNKFKERLISNLLIYYFFAAPVFLFSTYFAGVLSLTTQAVFMIIGMAIIFRSFLGWLLGLWNNSMSDVTNEAKKVSGLIAGAKCMWCSSQVNLELIKGELQEEGFQYANKDGSPDLRFKDNEMLYSFVSEYLCGDCGAVSNFRSKKSLKSKSFFGNVTPNKSTTIEQGRWIKPGRESARKHN